MLPRRRPHSFFRFAPSLLGAFLLLAAARPTWAQAVWTVTDLTPDGSTWAEINSLSGAEAGGDYVDGSGNTVATVWTRGAGNAWTAADLPVTGGNPTLRAVSGTTAGGVVNSDDDQAAVWNYDSGATTWTMTNLNPAGAGYSAVRAISGNQLGGYAYLGGAGAQAVVWTGTNPEPQNINPTGASVSEVHAMNGTQLGGSARFGGSDDHAVLWLSAGTTVTDLNPAGAAESRVSAMTATQQGGASRTAAANFHATLWSGTAESAVDLNGSFNASELTAMVDGFQVGYTDSGAALWMGSAESYVNLSPFITDALGSAYTYTYASSVTVDAGILYIGGYATDANFELPAHAFVLSTSVASLAPVPEPSTYAAILGAAMLGGAAWARRRRRR